MRYVKLPFLLAVWLIALLGACDFYHVARGASDSSSSNTWTLTTGDLSEQAVRLEEIDGKQLVITPAGSRKPSVLPMEQFLELTRPIDAPVGAGPWTVLLSHGNQITGQPVSLSNETLVWNNPLLGDISLPLQSVRAMVRGPAPMDRPARERTQDLVQLQNGDSIGGVVTKIDAAHVTINSDGHDAPIPWDSVRSVVLVPTGAARPALEFRVTLADGSALAISTIQMTQNAPGSVRLILADGAERVVRAETLVAVEHVHGPVRWLGEMEPSVSEQVPYMPGAEAIPARMNRLVNGDPIRIGGRMYRHGIGVHAYSRLIFELPQGASTFRTRYALEPGRYANVVVRIKLDDQTVYESSDAVAGVVSPAIDLSLKGARRLTLEVDYGAGLDVQDRFVWIQPALIGR